MSHIALGVEEQEGPGNGQSCEGPQHVVRQLLVCEYLTMRIRPMAIVSMALFLLADGIIVWKKVPASLFHQHLYHQIPDIARW